MTQKCSGIFLLPICIIVWNIKAAYWKKIIVSETKCLQTDGRMDRQINMIPVEHPPSGEALVTDGGHEWLKHFNVF